VGQFEKSSAVGGRERATRGGIPLTFYLFRPAYIFPVDLRKEPNLSYHRVRWIHPAVRVLFPIQVIRARDLAWTMVGAVVTGTAQRAGPVFENGGIRAMVESFHAHG